MRRGLRHTVIALALVVGACTGSESASTTAPSATSSPVTTSPPVTTTTAPVTTTTAATTTTTEFRVSTTTTVAATTTTAPQPMALDEYLAGVFQASRDAGVNAAAFELSTAPTPDAYRAVTRAFGAQLRILKTLVPPDEAVGFHERIVGSTEQGLALYQDLTDAVEAGDVERLQTLSEDALSIVDEGLAIGLEQQALLEMVLADRDDDLSRYVLETTDLGAGFAGEIQELFTDLQTVLSGPEDIPALVALVETEIALFEGLTSAWAGLRPPPIAAQYHTGQLILSASMGGRLQDMLEAIEVEDFERFSEALRAIVGLIPGAGQFADLQADLFIAALSGVSSDAGADAWGSVPVAAVFGEFEFVNDIAASEAGFVAVGSSVWFSSDGLTWTRAPLEVRDPLTFTFDIVSGVAGGGPGFVAVGEGSTEDGSAAAVWTSLDGRSWDRVGHDPEVFGSGDLLMRFVAAGSDGVVAVGDRQTGNETQPTREAAMWFSPDGVAWQRVLEHPATTDVLFFDVTATSFGFFAVGRSPGGALIWASDDGTSWTEHILDDEGTVSSVIETAGRLVAVGSVDGPAGSDGAVWTSTDGVEWQRVDAAVLGGFGSQTLLSVAETAAGLVVVGVDTPTGGEPAAAAWASTDGTEWRRIEGFDGAGREFSQARFVVPGATGAIAIGTAVWLGYLDG